MRKKNIWEDTKVNGLPMTSPKVSLSIWVPLSNNKAQYGGGIHASGSSSSTVKVHVENSTLQGNSAEVSGKGSGGGMYIYSGGTRAMECVCGT